MRCVDWCNLSLLFCCLCYCRSDGTHHQSYAGMPSRFRLLSEVPPLTPFPCGMSGACVGGARAPGAESRGAGDGVCRRIVKTVIAKRGRRGAESSGRSRRRRAQEWVGGRAAGVTAE